MAQRKTKSQWLSLFDDQKRSGLSVSKFCKNKQLSEAYFYLKRKMLQSQDSQLSTFVAARPETSVPDTPVTLQFGQCQLQIDANTCCQCDGSHAGTEYLPVIYKAKETKVERFCGCSGTGNRPFCDGTHQFKFGGGRDAYYDRYS